MSAAWIESLAPVWARWPEMAAMAALLMLCGVFAAGELAVLRLRRMGGRPPELRGKLRRRLGERLLARPGDGLRLTRLGFTATTLGLAWLLVRLLAAWQTRPAASAALFLGLLTACFLAAQVGRRLVADRPVQQVPLLILLVTRGLLPIGAVLGGLLDRIAILLTPVSQSSDEPDDSEDEREEELRSMLTSGDGHYLPEQKRELLDNVFELSHRTARQAMVPRADVVYLSTERSLEDNLALARQSGHTRFPLCEGDLDKVQGLVHIKDLFRAASPPSCLQDIARPISFIPETLTLDRLLRRMRAERRHLMAVVDEYGGVRGIVTLENVIEELVGEIQDEFDRETPNLIRAGRNRYRVAGAMLVDDLEEELNIDLGDVPENTIGGIVLSQLGRQPRSGDLVDLGPIEVKVSKVQENRIRELAVKLQPAATPPGQDDTSERLSA